MAKPLPTNFEAALSELEGLIQAMEKGEMPLEDMLNAYQQGMGLIQFCQTKLSAVEQQLNILDGDELHPLDRPDGQ